MDEQHPKGIGHDELSNTERMNDVGVDIPGSDDDMMQSEDPDQEVPTRSGDTDADAPPVDNASG